MTDGRQPKGEREYWLDRPANVRKVYLAVWAACALLLVAEPFVHKHAEVPAESWFGFHGWFGFVACVGLVLAAKWLRRLIRRPEDFYER
jgi:hypothetical protein